MYRHVFAVRIFTVSGCRDRVRGAKTLLGGSTCEDIKGYMGGGIVEGKHSDCSAELKLLKRK